MAPLKDLNADLRDTKSTDKRPAARKNLPKIIVDTEQEEEQNEAAPSFSGHKVHLPLFGS